MFTKDDFKRCFQSRRYSPECLVGMLELQYKNCFDKCVSSHLGHTLKEHTLRVLKQFEKYYSKRRLPGNVDKNLFRFLLAIHDLGKPRATRNPVRDMHHISTIGLVKPLLRKLNVGGESVQFIISLLSGDPIGTYLQQDCLEKSAKQIRTMALCAGIPVNKYLDILLVYYKVDAGSYTKDAGGKRYLDDLFIFDHKRRTIRFSRRIAGRINMLKAYIRASNSDNI